jgi:protein-tyrosine phosphatase
MHPDPAVMKYGLLFLAMGIVLALQAGWLGGAGWMLVWPGLSFTLVGMAYLGLGPRVFGKRPDGTMAWGCVAALLPYLLLTWFTWHLARSLSREACCQEVAPGMFIGRRPYPAEVPASVTLIVDLTAEFPERFGVRHGREYVSVPLLDTETGTEGVFTSLVERIANWKGPAYIHCAQGHGRTGMVAAAVLVAKGQCATIDDAVRKLQSVRPRLALGKRQLAFVRNVCKTFVPGGQDR